MKNLNITLITIIILTFTSCIATNRGYQSSPVISRNIDLDPIKADIKVDETAKIKGQSTCSYFLIFRVSGDNSFADGIQYSTDASASPLQQLNPFKIIRSGRIAKVRGAAAYKALSSGNYDVLVHPNYTTTIENYLIFKKYDVKVEGYGAKYENFRTEKQKIVILEDGKELILQDK
tara:strand:- start:265 stop:792 length:528 start_codon:yes stop_codon:yes gene_type:complete